MRIHLLRHEQNVSGGSVAAWARQRRSELTQTRFYTGDSLPRLSTVDLLVILGGSMHVYAYDQHAWLVAEKDFIWSALQRRTRVLGIGLGAQLIADVLAAGVTRSRHPEFGWQPVLRTEAGSRSRLFAGWPARVAAFLWHADVHELPHGMHAVLRSAACDCQGFTDDERVVGLQFHPEITPRWLAPLLPQAPAPTLETPFVQTVPQLQAGVAEHLPHVRQAFFDLLDRLMGLEAGHSRGGGG